MVDREGEGLRLEGCSLLREPGLGGTVRADQPGGSLRRREAANPLRGVRLPGSRAAWYKPRPVLIDGGKRGGSWNGSESWRC